MSADSGNSQSRYTGLSPRGTNGTRASLPHSEQMAVCISRVPPPPPRLPPPKPPALRFARQSGQREGEFVNPFSAWNSCSPAENTNSALQSLQVNVVYVTQFSLLIKSSTTSVPLIWSECALGRDAEAVLARAFSQTLWTVHGEMCWGRVRPTSLLTL